MKRWNGWGDESQTFDLPDAARTMLAELVGPGTPPRDATLADSLGAVPATRIVSSPQGVRVSSDAEARLRHARGQSLGDWIALRSGRFGVFPDAVAFPQSGEEVRALLRFAREAGLRLIPYGGGTSVVGHINPLAGERPVLTVSMERMSSLLDLDERSQLATFGAGVLGPHLESQLSRHRYTLGHFPQSFEHASLGGWVVTRSSGQQSLGYGRIERLFAGGTLESPQGTLVLPPFPAAGAGPDVREMVLGSEGRFGILTEAVVRVTPAPERDDVVAVFFPSWEKGLAAVREIVQARTPLSMLRLSTPVETRTSLSLTSHPRLLRALETYLSARGVRKDKCLMLAGLTGGDGVVRLGKREVLEIARARKGVSAGKAIGRQWQKNRFRAPYLRNSLWDAGYAVDTLETATTWTRVPGLLQAIETALSTAIAHTGEKVHVFTHLSHAYPSGSSIYTTYLFRLSPDPDETLARWRLLKDAASRAITAGGGTISHQHGVGTDHAPYLAVEKGALGMAAIGDLARRFDPDGLMNPGKLLP